MMHSPIIGSDPMLRELLEVVRRAAPLAMPVIVRGETGTGKELIAAELHHASGRRGRFQAVNVASLPEELADSELFGCERGAFTGAIADRAGLIAAAQSGTLYLDEAGDLPPALQAKLLRVLESGSVRAVGAATDRTVDFRLVVSVQDLPASLVAAHRWRPDFYYRVAGIEVVLPPLRERPADIGVLAAHFLRVLGRPPLEPGAAAPLLGYEWPGNVRELRRVIERAAFLAGSGAISAEQVRRALGSQRGGVPDLGVYPSLAEVERDHIRTVLQATGGSTRRAAELLGLSRSQLYRRLAQHGITPPRFDRP